jgi:hypothetical protein
MVSDPPAIYRVVAEDVPSPAVGVEHAIIVVFFVKNAVLDKPKVIGSEFWALFPCGVSCAEDRYALNSCIDIDIEGAVICHSINTVLYFNGAGMDVYELAVVYSD